MEENQQGHISKTFNCLCLRGHGGGGGDTTTKATWEKVPNNTYRQVPFQLFSRNKEACNFKL